MKLKVQLQGDKAVLEGFKKFGKAGEEMVKDITEIKAKDIERNAKSKAPVDHGTLRQNIVAQKIKELSWKITAFMPYSAFMEFGTGGLVRVPNELKNIAILFKGKGIRKINIRPQPFMYPAFLTARQTYSKDLKQGLKILTEKFNND